MATQKNIVVSGQLVDVHTRSIYPAEITVSGKKIKSIKKVPTAPEVYILPGFVDAHIHIESSMLPPSSFARLAVMHGTVATVSDPHEIANVCGVEGIEYMIQNAKKVPFHFCFGAPPCVPATTFETSGAELNADTIDYLLRDKHIGYLSEMMNYPAVLNRDKEKMRMIKSAKRYGKPVDGHAPGLRGMDAKIYASAGITTDHECSTLEEAIDKINSKMLILIREGSAAKNFEALHTLIGSHPDKVMFCCDDKHPDELVKEHINRHVARSIALGYNLYDVLHIACVKPVQHYKLPVGLLREEDSADFIVVKDLINFEVVHTMIKGQWVAKDGISQIPYQVPELINRFHAQPIKASSLQIHTKHKQEKVRVIVAKDGQLLTKEDTAILKANADCLQADLLNDVLKIAVINRYALEATPALGFIKGFGLKKGAIASTVAHDSHNIVAVGADDESLALAINLLIERKGGLSCVTDENNTMVMPLAIAGLMHDGPPEKVAEQYHLIDSAAKKLGSTLSAPYMTLSFMALLVIPTLKMSDRGLFDGATFQMTSCMVN